MKFVQKDVVAAAKAAAVDINKHLAGGTRIIWLVCGGSNIATEVEIMAQVRAQSAGMLANLLILPMDERFGKPGHADSNYKQMQDAGFDSGEALWVDVLAKDLPLAETVEYFAGLVQTSFPSADYVVGVFGLGTDGHTAGVLPKSPAVYESVTSTVGYDSPPFVRLTLSPQELIRTNTAYVLAYGESKKKPLERLKKNAENMEDLPAKLLYDIPEVYVYNDQIESEAEK